MHSTKFLAAILAVAGTGLAMPLEAPTATPARKLSPEAISAILNAAPGPVVAKSMPAADKILPNDAIEKIRGLRGPGVVAPTAAFSGPLKLTKRPARTSSATSKPTASSAAGIPTTSLATVSSTAATATGTTTPKVTSVGVTGTPARPSPATGTATNTTGTATAPTKAHLAARGYPSNLADLVRVGPQIEKKRATAIPANMTSQEYCAPRIEKIRQKGIEAGDKVGEPSMATKRAELKAMVGCIIEILTDAWLGPENAKPTATPAPNAPDCAYIMEEGVKEIMAKGDAAVEDNEAFQQCIYAEAMSQSSALEKRGRITHIPVLDDATRERLIREGEIIVLTGKRKPGTKPKHQQS
ncbi:hypothetical protein K4K58_009648 [Colletotrichum sp. SAR11_239]|nr:hypothetical protein K4K58_009648 [Colletotrichum sp. SAR11_239]